MEMEAALVTIKLVAIASQIFAIGVAAVIAMPIVGYLLTGK